MNYFAHRQAARRYARSRPFFHPLVIRRIGERLALRAPLARALDVGCGTGQSTHALREIAREVIGTDISKEMLRAATPADGVHFLVADAHRLPFAAGSFNLVTVSMAFHWLRRACFLREARRVLRMNGWLVIYNNFFFGRMEEHDAFERWHRDVYLARYPSPPRDAQPLTAAEAAQHRFSFAAPEEYTNTVRLTRAELADYLTTQSNLIAAVEQRRETYTRARAWLMSQLRELFPAPRCTFHFGGYIWRMQKVKN